MPNPSIYPGFGSIVWSCLALLALLGLLWGAKYVARRHGLGPLGRPGRLGLAETIAIDTKRRVHLIRCDQRFLLLETGGAQDVMLGWLPLERPSA